MEALCRSYSIPRTMLVAQMGLSYESFLRWRRRIKTGQEPVCRPGPKKLEPLDIAGLRQAVANLEHGRKRTHDTGAIYRS